MHLEYARMAREGEFCSQPEILLHHKLPPHLEIRKSINAKETAFVSAFEMVDS